MLPLQLKLETMIVWNSFYVIVLLCVCSVKATIGFDSGVVWRKQHHSNI